MNNSIIGAIITGGKSSRMKFINKSFLSINNKSFIELIISTLSLRLDNIYINANKDISNYKKYNIPVVPDYIKGFKGPLAGLHSIMKVFEYNEANLWFALVPTDAPIIPVEYLDNFINNLPIKKNVIISKINNRIEPMFSFWSISTLKDIEKSLINNDGLKIMKMAEDLGYDLLEFQTKNNLDFMNINTQDDYLKFKKLSRISN